MSNVKEIRDWVIYRITNPNGRVYIGKSCNWRVRLFSYKNGNTHKQRALHNSLVKYGFENHKIDIIDNFSSNGEFASGKEIFWIRTYMSHVNRFPHQKGLNLTDGGEGGLGTVRSMESREKARQRMLGTKFNYTKEQRDEISNRHKGNKYNLGRKHSPEICERRRQIATGKFKDAVGKENCRKAQIISKGKPIIQLNEAGEVINEFTHVKEAAIHLGIERHTITRLINGTGKFRYSHTIGLILKYKNK